MLGRPLRRALVLPVVTHRSLFAVVSELVFAIGSKPAAGAPKARLAKALSARLCGRTNTGQRVDFGVGFELQIHPLVRLRMRKVPLELRANESPSGGQ